MIQSHSQNPPTRYYPETQYSGSSSEFIALQFTVSNNTQILYITAGYKKMIYLQNRMEKKILEETVLLIGTPA
jgi:hypothetical protein